MIPLYLADVRFSHDKSRLITIGTDDRTIIQWTFLSESESIAFADTQKLNLASTSARMGANESMSGDFVDAALEDPQLLETAQQVGSYLDSDSEASDSDLSGSDIDSDIEKEKEVSHKRTLYREDYQVKCFFKVYFS